MIRSVSRLLNWEKGWTLIHTALRSLTATRSINLEIKERLEIGRHELHLFGSVVDFFNRGKTWACVSWDGNMPGCMERLHRLQITGEMFFDRRFGSHRSHVGIGTRAHDFEGEVRRSRTISRTVAGSNVRMSNVIWCCAKRSMSDFTRFSGNYNPGVLGFLPHHMEQVSLAFLLTFHSNYVPILHRFWDIARYWSKIDDFNLPHLCLARVIHWNFAEIFRVRKLEPRSYRIALFAWSYSLAIIIIIIFV